MNRDDITEGLPTVIHEDFLLEYETRNLRLWILDSYICRNDRSTEAGDYGTLGLSTTGTAAETGAGAETGAETGAGGQVGGSALECI